MARLNRSSLPFMVLAVSLGTVWDIGCGFDTHGMPPDDTTSSTSSGTGGIGGAAGAGGTGGGGMAGAGGAMGCNPGMNEPCYSGPPKTPNIGICKAGTKTCLADGTGFGACVGEVVPVLENCVSAGDEDCDGYKDLEDSECKCTVAGMKAPCDTGLLGTCSVGVGICSADGRSVDSCAQTNMPSPENCATADDDDCDGTAAATCTGDPKWVYTAGGGGATTKDDAVYSVAYTADGGSIIAGVVDGTIAMDGYGVMMAGTAYVAKLDANKAIIWEKKFTSSMFAVVRGVAVDSAGNVIIVGSFSGTMAMGMVDLVSDGPDSFHAKLDPAGTVLWTRQLTAKGMQNSFGVAVDATDNIFVTGSTDDAVDFGDGKLTEAPSGSDVFIASYDASNVLRWGILYVNPGTQMGRAIAATSMGDIVVVGDTNEDTDLGGGVITKDKSVDIFVARYSGIKSEHLWSKLFGKGADQFGRAVAMTPDDHVLITGGFDGKIDWNAATSMTAIGSSDVYVAKLNGTTGDYLAHLQGGKAGTSFGTSIGADAAGNVTLVGNVNGSVDFGGQLVTSSTGMFDAFLVKLKAEDWKPLWTKQFGKMGHQYGWDLAVANDGSALVGGGFYTELTVPPAMASIPSTGGSDLYAVNAKP